MHFELDRDLLNYGMTIHGTIKALSTEAKISYKDAKGIVLAQIKSNSMDGISKAMSGLYIEVYAPTRDSALESIASSVDALAELIEGLEK